MDLQLPSAVLVILSTLQSHGFTCEIVGGAVRDVLLGRETTDWDFTTNATPEEILPLFQESFYENQFGTVMLAHKHLLEQFPEELSSSPLPPDLVFDITTYRADGEYRNHRKPESVVWGKTIEEDLERRDFTINAIALRVSSNDSIEINTATNPGYELVHVELIDPFHGEDDLENKVIRTVGDPDARFSEDALRMLRAIRFANSLQFTIDGPTLTALQKHAEELRHISFERISSEFMSMMASDTPDIAIVLLDKFGLLAYIIPELLAAKGVRQSGHHIYDVWEHSIRALAACESNDPVVRLATLLHDIAKPITAQETHGGTVTFYNHEVIGARMAKEIGKRLRLPKEACDRMFTLVRWHMFTYETFVTDAYIRRFLRRVGTENMEDMFALRTGDRIGSGSKATSWRLEELKDRIWAELHQPLKVTDLAIDGNDLMQAFEIKPGPIIGKVLNDLLEDVLENPDHNTKELLLEKARALIV